MNIFIRAGLIMCFWIVIFCSGWWLYTNKLYRESVAVYPLDYQTMDELVLTPDTDVEMRFRAPYDGLSRIDLMGVAATESTATVQVKMVVEGQPHPYEFWITGEMLSIGPLLSIELPEVINAKGKLLSLLFRTVNEDSMHPMRLKMQSNFAFDKKPFKGELFIGGVPDERSLVFRPIFTGLEEEILTTDIIIWSDEWQRLVASWGAGKPRWVQYMQGILWLDAIVSVSWWWWNWIDLILLTKREWMILGVGLAILYLIV